MPSKEEGPDCSEPSGTAAASDVIRLHRHSWSVTTVGDDGPHGVAGELTSGNAGVCHGKVDVADDGAGVSEVVCPVLSGGHVNDRGNYLVRSGVREVLPRNWSALRWGKERYDFGLASRADCDRLQGDIALRADSDSHFRFPSMLLLEPGITGRRNSDVVDVERGHTARIIE